MSGEPLTLSSSEHVPAHYLREVSVPTAPETSTVKHRGRDAAFDPSHLSPMSRWTSLSDGGYSEVYKAKLLGTSVAVKQATSRKKTSGDALLREIKYLRLAGPHPNIVTVYGAFSERGKLHLVLEYASSLRADRVARACEPLVVVSGIARALVRLHGNGIIHRDLKARNVLVASDNRPMLIDFGLACHTGLDPPEWVCRTVGTKKYRPPEMRDGRPAHPSMDMFCFGLLIEKLLKQRRERGSDEAAPAERGDEASRRGDEASRREHDSERGDEASRRGDERHAAVTTHRAVATTHRAGATRHRAGATSGASATELGSKRRATVGVTARRRHVVSARRLASAGRCVTRRASMSGVQRGFLRRWRPSALRASRRIGRRRGRR